MGQAICDTRGRAECANAAEFSVTADGYACAMFPGVCSGHVGAVLAADAAVAGSTLRWTVEAL